MIDIFLISSIEGRERRRQVFVMAMEEDPNKHKKAPLNSNNNQEYEILFM